MKKIIKRFLFCTAGAIGIVMVFWWIDYFNPSLLQIVRFVLAASAIIIPLIIMIGDLKMTLSEKITMILKGALFVIIFAGLFFLIGQIITNSFGLRGLCAELTILTGFAASAALYGLIYLANKLSNLKKKQWYCFFSWFFPIISAILTAIAFYLYVLP